MGIENRRTVFSFETEVWIRGCVTGYSEELGIEINVKWVYLLRMIKIESIKRGCETLLNHSKGQTAIPQDKFVVSCVCDFSCRFYQACMAMEQRKCGGEITQS